MTDASHITAAPVKQLPLRALEAATSSPTRIPPRARAVAPAIPSLAFAAANGLGGVKAAIVAATVASAVLIASRLRRGWRVGWFLPISLLYVGGRGVAGLLSGSDDVYFGTGLAVSAVVALLALASAMTSSPAAGAVIPVFVSYSSATVAHPRYRGVARRVTVIWATSELAVTIWEAHHLVDATAGEFVGLRMLVGWPTMFLLVGILIFYVHFRLDPLEMQHRDRGRLDVGSITRNTDYK